MNWNLSGTSVSRLILSASSPAACSSGSLRASVNPFVVIATVYTHRHTDTKHESALADLDAGQRLEPGHDVCTVGPDERLPARQADLGHALAGEHPGQSGSRSNIQEQPSLSCYCLAILK